MHRKPIINKHRAKNTLFEIKHQTNNQLCEYIWINVGRGKKVWASQWNPIT